MDAGKHRLRDRAHHQQRERRREAGEDHRRRRLLRPERRAGQGKDHADLREAGEGHEEEGQDAHPCEQEQERHCIRPRHPPSSSGS